MVTENAYVIKESSILRNRVLFRLKKKNIREAIWDPHETEQKCCKKNSEHSTHSSELHCNVCQNYVLYVTTFYNYSYAPFHLDQWQKKLRYNTL